VELDALLREQLPDYRVTSITGLGEGQENAAFEVNADLVLRVSKESDPAERVAVVRREARLLDVVARYASLPIPRPLFAAQGAMAYRKVPGVPLLRVPVALRRVHAERIAATVGSFLGRIQAIPHTLVAGLVGTDDDSFDRWMADAVDSWAAIRMHPHTARQLTAHSSAIEDFLRSAPAGSLPSLVFSHNDLGIEHILVDRDSLAVTGVIDFSDAALVDPAYDFALLLRDLGPGAFLAAVRAAFGHLDRQFSDRAWIYARCSVLEDLQYGLQTGYPAYVDKSLVSLEWLFADPR